HRGRAEAHRRPSLLSRAGQQHRRRASRPARDLLERRREKTRRDPGGNIVMSINVALAGAGAFGIKHLDAVRAIAGVKVVSLVGRERAKTEQVASKYGVPHATADLADSLAMKDVDAVILCTPTPMHASQAIACLRAGKHVQVEIPLCDNVKDGQAVVDAARR